MSSRAALPTPPQALAAPPEPSVVAAPGLPRQRPALGIALVIAATVFLGCSDTTAKYLASSLPAVEIAWIRYFVFSLIMLPAVLWQGPKRVLRSARPGLQIFRGFGLVTSSILFITGLRYLPVAEATATSFAAPLFITALSIPFLGERVGPRRWAATIVGLIGVLIVVRPGTSAFDPASILPLLSAFGWASAVVATRRTSAGDGAVTTLAYSAIVGVAVLSVLAPFVWIEPDWKSVALATFIGFAATTGHWLIVLAFRHGDASVLAPFTYSQLVWVTLFGWIAFGAVPDRWTLIGAAVIAASGIYTAHRETVRARGRAAGAV
jgi:drug/metabolite transporter (DMT)-like permease